jgi:hypothetical protein
MNLTFFIDTTFLLHSPLTLTVQLPQICCIRHMNHNFDYINCIGQRSLASCIYHV